VSVRRSPRHEYRDDVKADHVLNSLMRWYALAYQEHLPEGLRDLNPGLRDVPHRLIAGLPRLDWDIRIFSVLDLAGQVFGSRAGPRGQRNSFVGVMGEVHNEREPQAWYGQVQFFFEHDFAHTVGTPKRCHRFAWIKWFDWPELPQPMRTEKLQKLSQQANGVLHEFLGPPVLHLAKGRGSKSAILAGFEEAQRTRYLRQTVTLAELADHAHWPRLKRAYLRPDVAEIIPVHRLAFKWIPHRDGAHIVACRIPSNLHA